MINNITTWLDEVAERFPDKTGYADEEKTLSFSQMRNAVISTAYRIYERGLFKKPVAVFMEKGVDALSAMFATAYSGNFYTPIDIHMPAARVQKILEILQPALIITKDALLEQWQATATDDIPCITLQEPAALSDAQLANPFLRRDIIDIARALVRRPEILILDDSASALDFATDAALRKELANLDYKPSTVIISQRTSSIRHADRIVVLDDGEAVGIGTHEELLETCPVYREIYESQYGKED